MNVTTNGDYISPYHISQLKQAGLDSLTVSLHTFSQAGVRHVIRGARLAADAGILATVQTVLTTETYPRMACVVGEVVKNGLFFGLGVVQSKGGGFSKDGLEIVPSMGQQLDVFKMLWRIKRFGFVRNNLNYLTEAPSFYPNNWKCDPERDSFIHIGAGNRVDVCSDVRTMLRVGEVQLGESRWRELKRQLVERCGNCLYHPFSHKVGGPQHR